MGEEEKAGEGRERKEPHRKREPIGGDGPRSDSLALHLLGSEAGNKMGLRGRGALLSPRSNSGPLVRRDFLSLKSS